ncbi:PIN domain-containing protein [Candidatus Saccharibacteria bacterium]|nr:PIN domain-containing protein [Candidatus Saccharibacteria bacterium]NIW80639.1 PIN domain-containing protein [Calditrichia bacterium]
MNKSFLLIDTDVIIDYLRNRPEAVEFLEQSDSNFYISPITIAELYAGVRDGDERIKLETFVEAFQSIPVDDSIAQQGGLFKRDYGKSHGVGLADAIIAASSEKMGAILVTLNKKHFPMLSNILTPYEK